MQVNGVRKGGLCVPFAFLVGWQFTYIANVFRFTSLKICANIISCH